MDNNPNYQVLERDNTPGLKPEIVMGKLRIISFSSLRCHLNVLWLFSRTNKCNKKQSGSLKVSHKYETQ